jgi:hypothetical protein
MKSRSRFYIGRKKAQKEMCHPHDLKSLLIAEYNSSQNLVVKKDIRKMLDQLEQNVPIENSPLGTDESTTA